MSIFQKAQGFSENLHLQDEALTVRRPKHPCLAWCILIFHGEIFSRLVPEILIEDT
jgi:hypothetical protein